MRAFELWVAVAIVVATLGLAATAGAQSCNRAVPGLAAYEGDLKRAIQDEPEDLPMELRRHLKALASGDVAQADRVDAKVRRAHAALSELSPASGLVRLHGDMTDYYGAGVAVLDARSRGDEAAERAALLETWVGLRSFFANIRDLAVEHGCNAGDVEAIDQHYLPRLDAQIARLRRGEEPTYPY
jgi:hypothetical protein